MRRTSRHLEEDALKAPKTGNRIKMVTSDPDTGPIDRSSLVKGYAIEKNNCVLFTEEELSSVKLESARTLDKLYMCSKEVCLAGSSCG